MTTTCARHKLWGAKSCTILLQISNSTPSTLMARFWSSQPRRDPHSLHSPAPYGNRRRSLKPQRFVALALEVPSDILEKCVWMK
eukprot:s1018_g8.t1